MENKSTFKSESKLTFLEATGIIIGHGVGSGILATPFYASLNNWWDFIWIMALAYFGSLLLHLMIAELSYHNNGAMFVKCIENLFKGKARKVVSIIAAVFLGISVFLNCAGYVTGGGAAVQTLIYAIFNIVLNEWICFAIFYIFCALIVFFGMKAVGISEKYCSFAMAGIVIVLVFVTLFNKNLNGLSIVDNPSIIKMTKLFSIISFALSAVMSVPQAVKGLNGDKKMINRSIIAGISVTAILIIVLTLITKLNCKELTGNPAMLDIANELNIPWIAILNSIFVIFALATSFWANTLDLRDIVHEQTNLNLKLSWLIVSLPCLIISLLFDAVFAKFTILAGGIQVLTGLGIVIAYAFKRREVGSSPLIGVFGTLPFRIFVIVANLIATIGSVLSI